MEYKMKEALGHYRESLLKPLLKLQLELLPLLVLALFLLLHEYDWPRADTKPLEISRTLLNALYSEVHG